VFFVDASTVETIKSGLEGIARDSGVGPTAADALRWLSLEHREWLFVLDNADDPELKLGDWLPPCRHGNVLITSRNPGCRVYAPKFNCEVSGMKPEEAMDLLLTCAMEQDPDAPKTQALGSSIVRDLGYLALAIVQAGSYISQSCTLEEYPDVYKQSRADLLRQHSIQSTDDYEWTVYTTWEISWKRLGGLAATFLRLCASLHFDGITKEMFKKAAAGMSRREGSDGSEISNDSADTPSRQAAQFLSTFQTVEGCWKDFEFYKVIAELGSYSLISMNKERNVYSIHPLVHAWARDRMSIEERKAAWACSTEMLSFSIVSEYDAANYSFRRTLLSHIDEARTQGTMEGNLAAKFGLVYFEGGRWNEAEELFVRVLDLDRRYLGADHPFTLMIMRDLASTYRNQGQLTKAEELSVQVLEARKRVLGADHPDTLRSMAGLASTYSKQRRWKEAEELNVQVLEARKRVLGVDHPDTLTGMGNLASTYQDQGRWKEAEELHVQVLEARKRALGTDHPHTLTGMGHLASTYWNQGKLKEAEELDVQVLEARKRVLGADHPDTLLSMVNLAHTWKSQNRDEEAVALMQNAVNLWSGKLGSDHPDTVRSIKILNRWKR
jgi:tetratricopeptide (TPR) repeat protein